MSYALKNVAAVLLGLLAGCLLWYFLLGVQVQRHAPGLWGVRVGRILDCGLDYNGPAFTHAGTRLYLTCGPEDSGWHLELPAIFGR